MSVAAETPIVSRLQAEVERAVQRNIKGWDYLTSPGRAGGVCEKTTVIKRGTMNLYHYTPLVEEVYRTPVLFVMATTNRGYVFDLAPGQSLIEFLLKRGYDVYVLDWTQPSYEERRLRLEDYVQDFIPSSVAAIRERSGEDSLTLVGYCMGGVLSLIYSALNSPGPRNLVCFTTPFDWSKWGAFNIWGDPKHFDVDHIVDTLGNFPPELMIASIDMLRPMSRITAPVHLWDNMWNDEFVRTKRAFDKWAAETLAMPGEYYRRVAKDLLFGNKLYKGELVIDGQTLDVGAIKSSFLHAVAEHDHIVPYVASQELVQRIGSEDKEEVVLKGGHISVVAGAGAVKRLWPKLDSWLQTRSA